MDRLEYHACTADCVCLAERATCRDGARRQSIAEMSGEKHIVLGLDTRAVRHCRDWVTMLLVEQDIQQALEFVERA